VAYLALQLRFEVTLAFEAYLERVLGLWPAGKRPTDEKPGKIFFFENEHEIIWIINNHD